MKKVRDLVTLGVLGLLIAIPALAQQSQSPRTPSGEAAFFAVGKFVSLLAYDDAPVAVPAFPAEVTFTVGAPSKYKSKKFFLTAVHSAQHLCDGDATASYMDVAGFPMFPDPFANQYFECNDFDADTEGFHHHARTWFLQREIDGGPIVPALSLVTLHFSSALGTSLVGVVSVQARREK